MRDGLTGVYGYKIPLAFLLKGDRSGFSVNLGIWSPSNRERATQAVLESRVGVLGSVLASLYADIDLAGADPVLPRFPLAGVVLGHPSSREADPEAGGPLDRVIHAMQGSAWAVLVLADPVDESVVSDIRDTVLNELRSTQAETQATAESSPLSDFYQQFLQYLLVEYTGAQAEGAWRTGVYLLGDASSYHRLASVWRSAFSGDESVVEPVRVYERTVAASLACDWALPDVGGLNGPGAFRHPFSHQTLLTSTELASYVQLPQRETTGFFVRLTPDFDLMPADVDPRDAITLGGVVERTRPTDTPYLLSTSMLSRHALVAGVTGSGKTNTVFHLLVQLWERGIPFLVIEPAKTEYRHLLDHPSVGSALQVFTPGAETISPMRLNPFEFEPGITVVNHIDLLKSVFNASFGMWDPLPQILERCIHDVYADCGWDPARGGNDRLGARAEVRSEIAGLAFPTLLDLSVKAAENIEGLGYEERTTSHMKAALLTRIDSLRIGAKGMLLDTHRSVPVRDLLARPTVIELEGIGDDDEKAFVMGLLLVRIYEHLRGQGTSEGRAAGHLTVIEEAHRLLANVPQPASQEQSNVRGKAVEAFTNMLSEVRSYGEGFLVAEQIPAKLAADVMKNTNLKVAHRVVSEDDRRALGGTMNMAEEQIAMLATLRTGEAAVFSEGDDRPLLVQVPYAKVPSRTDMSSRGASDARVAAHMAEFRRSSGIADLFVPDRLCPAACGEPYRYCDDAKALLAGAEFRRQFASLALACVLALDDPRGSGPGVVTSRLTGLLDTVRAQVPARALSEGVYSCVLLNATASYVSHLGRAYNWPFATGDLVREELAQFLVGSLRALRAGQPGPDVGSRSRLHEAYEDACHRTQDPFPECGRVCPSGLCLFRYHVRELLDERGLAESFNVAMARAAAEGVWGDPTPLQEVMARFGAADYPPDLRRSLALCYAMQRIAYMPGLLEVARRMASSDVIDGFDASDTEEGTQ